MDSSFYSSNYHNLQNFQNLRTYATTSSIQIKVTDTTVELMNEGGLPFGMHPDDLKKTHLSRPRNRLLADVFYKGGLIESWGRGTLKVIESCVKAGFPEPVFEINEHFFGIVLYRKNIAVEDKNGGVNGGVNEGLNEGLNKGLKTLFQTIQKNEGIQAKDLPKILNNRSLKTIEGQIAQLIKKKLIIRKGSRKTGGYFVKRNSDNQ